MGTFKDEAKAYVPPQSKVISDLEVVRTDIEIHEGDGVDKNNTPYKYKYILDNDEKYRVPGSVFEQLQTILKTKPDVKTVKVERKGSGLNTKYTVIQLD